MSIAVSMLPNTLKRFYEGHQVPAENIVGSRFTDPDDIQTVEVEFTDDTMDIWEWTKNPDPTANPRFPNTWVRVEIAVPIEEDAVAA